MNVVTAYFLAGLSWAGILAYETTLQTLLYTPFGVSGIAMCLMAATYRRQK